MIQIEKRKNAHGYDVVIIKTEEGAFEISFQNNLDLYWRYIHKGDIRDNPSTHEFTITKENYFIYELFDDLYNTIKAGKIYYDLNSDDNLYLDEDDLYFNSVISEQKINNYDNLFKDGVIDWHSDDFTYETGSRLLIKPDGETYKVIFEKSKEDYDTAMFMTFSVRIRNSGSTYDPCNIVFMNMYNKLKQYDPTYHQIHIEEHLYNQKVLRK